MPLVVNIDGVVHQLWGIVPLFLFQALLPLVYSDNLFPTPNASGICGSTRNNRTESYAGVFH